MSLMAWCTYTDLLYFLLSACFTFIFTFAFIIIRCRCNRKRAVAFFHPYTNDGGGGERVLWCAIKAIQELSPGLDCVVYSGDHVALARAIDRFGVKLHYPPKVVHLHKRKWIEEITYPRFTMIGQSLGSVYLSWEALCKFNPVYYFETSGYAFTYPLAPLFGCKVMCYTHYPTISLDMLSRVRDRSAMYNNEASIAKSIWLSRCKVIYYTLFSRMYGIVGSSAHLAVVTLHGLNLTSKSFGRFQAEPSGSTLPVTLLDFRCFHLRDLWKFQKSSPLLNFV